jgi:hypothetical protein
MKAQLFAALMLPAVAHATTYEVSGDQTYLIMYQGKALRPIVFDDAEWAVSLDDLHLTVSARFPGDMGFNIDGRLRDIDFGPGADEWSVSQVPFDVAIMDAGQAYPAIYPGVLSLRNTGQGLALVGSVEGPIDGTMFEFNFSAPCRRAETPEPAAAALLTAGAVATARRHRSPRRAR